MTNPICSAEAYCILLKAKKELAARVRQSNDAKSHVARKFNDTTLENAQLLLDQFSIDIATESLQKLDAVGIETYEFASDLTPAQIAREINASLQNLTRRQQT